MNQGESESVDYLDHIETQVKRANLRALLYISPGWGLIEGGLSELARQGRISWVAPTGTSLGGWHWIPAHRISARSAQA